MEPIKKLKDYYLGTVENIVGSKENAGYQHFLLFQQHFQRSFFQRLLPLPVFSMPVLKLSHFPFSPEFTEDLYYRHVKRTACLVTS